MSAVFYYLIIKPLSFLPFWILYRLSDIFFLISYFVIPYRKKVIRANLTHSFPQKSKKEIRSLERKFYRHLGDLIVESVKLFSISSKNLQKRYKKRNPEVMNRLYDQRESVIVIAGHYNNWEMAGAAFPFLLKHKILGIYAPLHDKFFNKKVNESRGAFGSLMIPMRLTKRYMVQLMNELIAPCFGADQSPTASKHVVWLKFLNQDTAFFIGPEKYAIEFDFPVVYCAFHKVKRGYYEMEFEVVEENPRNTSPGEITEKHVRLLENQILEKPEFWLWSHRRWKQKKPTEIG